MENELKKIGFKKLGNQLYYLITGSQLILTSYDGGSTFNLEHSDNYSVMGSLTFYGGIEGLKDFLECFDGVIISE